MRRLHPATAVTALVLAGVGLAGGCGGSDGGGASPGAPPETGAAVGTTAPPDTTAAGTPADAPPARPGRAAVGAEVFAMTCQGCHASGGRRAAFGPRLAGLGLSEAETRRVVVNGRDQMPAGLVSGQELEDVIAHVASLQ